MLLTSTSTRCPLHYCKHIAPTTPIALVHNVRGLCCRQGSSRNGGKNGSKWVAFSLPSLAVSAVPCQPSPGAAASLPDATESLSIPTGGGAGSIFRQAFFFNTKPPALTVSRHTKTHRRLFFLVLHLV